MARRFLLPGIAIIGTIHLACRRARQSSARQVATRPSGVHVHAPYSNLAHIGRAASALGGRCKVIAVRARERAADLATILAELQASDVTTLHDIAAALNDRGIPTASGTGQWQATSVNRLLARLPRDD
jgi:hypothetical protein